MCSRKRNNVQRNLFMIHVSALVHLPLGIFKPVGQLYLALAGTLRVGHIKYQESSMHYFLGTLYVPFIPVRSKAAASMFSPKVGFEHAAFIQVSTWQVPTRQVSTQRASILWNQPSRSLSAARVETA